MNRKTLLTIISIFIALACFGTVLAWGIYSILNIPSIKEGLDGAGHEFSALLDLQQKVQQAYPSGEVSVQIMNGNTLNISLINSKFAELSESQQSTQAHKVALFVKDNYTGKAQIDRIVIIFIKNTQIGPLNTNWSYSYPFTVSELQ